MSKKPNPFLIDDDNPRWTAEDFAKAEPIAQILPELASAMKQKRGRPKSNTPKAQINMRLDANIVAWLRAQQGYNGIVNETLRVKMQEHRST